MILYRATGTKMIRDKDSKVIDKITETSDWMPTELEALGQISLVECIITIERSNMCYDMRPRTCR